MSYFCGDVGINGTVYVFSTVPEGMKGLNTVASNISPANFMWKPQMEMTLEKIQTQI